MHYTSRVCACARTYRMDSKYSSCDAYCGAHGRDCVGAWEESGDSCAVKDTYTCSADIGDIAETSDALCECSPGDPPCYSWECGGGPVRPPPLPSPPDSLVPVDYLPTYGVLHWPKGQCPSGSRSVGTSLCVFTTRRIDYRLGTGLL